MEVACSTSPCRRGFPRRRHGALTSCCSTRTADRPAPRRSLTVHGPRHAAAPRLLLLRDRRRRPGAADPSRRRQADVAVDVEQRLLRAPPARRDAAPGRRASPAGRARRRTPAGWRWPCPTSPTGRRWTTAPSSTSCARWSSPRSSGDVAAGPRRGRRGRVGGVGRPRRPGPARPGDAQPLVGPPDRRARRRARSPADVAGDAPTTRSASSDVRRARSRSPSHRAPGAGDRRRPRRPGRGPLRRTVGAGAVRRRARGAARRGRRAHGSTASARSTPAVRRSATSLGDLLRAQRQAPPPGLRPLGPRGRRRRRSRPTSVLDLRGGRRAAAHVRPPPRRRDGPLADPPGRPSAHVTLAALGRRRPPTATAPGSARRAAILAGDLAFVWADELLRRGLRRSAHAARRAAGVTPTCAPR